jgi:hypothetical protein
MIVRIPPDIPFDRALLRSFAGRDMRAIVDLAEGAGGVSAREESTVIPGERAMKS